MALKKNSDTGASTTPENTASPEQPTPSEQVEETPSTPLDPIAAAYFVSTRECGPRVYHRGIHSYRVQQGVRYAVGNEPGQLPQTLTDDLVRGGVGEYVTSAAESTPASAEGETNAGTGEEPPVVDGGLIVVPPDPAPTNASTPPAALPAPEPSEPATTPEG